MPRETIASLNHRVEALERVLTAIPKSTEALYTVLYDKLRSDVSETVRALMGPVTEKLGVDMREFSGIITAARNEEFVTRYIVRTQVAKTLREAAQILDKERKHDKKTQHIPDNFSVNDHKYFPRYAKP